MSSRKKPHTVQTQRVAKANKPDGSSLIAAERSFSGPVPAPETLKGYDLIVPGAAERIIAMAEREAAHTHKMETGALEAHKSEVRRGQWMGFVLGLSSLAVSAHLALNGQPYVAGIIGGTTAVGFVAAFITGRIKKT